MPITPSAPKRHFELIASSAASSMVKRQKPSYQTSPTISLTEAETGIKTSVVLAIIERGAEHFRRACLRLQRKSRRELCRARVVAATARQKFSSGVLISNCQYLSRKGSHRRAFVQASNHRQHPSSHMKSASFATAATPSSPAAPNSASSVNQSIV